MRLNFLSTNVFTNILVFFVSILLIEIFLHIMVQSHSMSSGTILGLQLPPYRLFPPKREVVNPDEPYQDLVIDGQAVTQGDLWGLMEEDQVLGHKPRSASRSKNGWWQSNFIGARRRFPTPQNIEKEKTRFLLYGDSFAQGSRVRQEETIPYFMEKESDQLEWINLAVDGYGVGQAYMRYLETRNLDAHAVVLIIVPSVDWWRDININRYLGGGWKSYKLNPRFVIKEGQLEWIVNPYQNLDEMYRKNSDRLNEALIEHLRKYDRFYHRILYEPVPVLDVSVLFRMMRILIWKVTIDLNGSFQRERKFEAIHLLNQITKAMRTDAQDDHSEFTLVILPIYSDVIKYQSNEKFVEHWQDQSKKLCDQLPRCFDLMEGLQLEASRLDRGYDGTHYGPKANKIIANKMRELFAKSIVRKIGGVGTAAPGPPGAP